MDIDDLAMLAAQRADTDVTDRQARRHKVRSDLEGDMRGLIMAARLHGFRITINSSTCGRMVGAVHEVAR